MSEDESTGTVGGYGRGLAFLQKQRAKYGGGKADFTPKLFLKLDGSIAKFRFLLDENSVFTHNFHEVPMTSRAGKAYKKDVVCTRKIKVEDDEVAFADPPESCQFCSREEPLPTWWKGMTWVYVYGFFHQTRVSDRCVPAKRGEGEHEVHGFVEKIGEPWLFPLKGIVSEQVFGAAGLHGTLLDRDYELKRNGKVNPGAPFYILYGLDKSERGEEVDRVAAELPDLIETVLEEFSVQGTVPSQGPPAPVTPPGAPPEPAGEAPEGRSDEDAAPRSDEEIRF